MVNKDSQNRESNVQLNLAGYDQLNTLIRENSFSKVFILVDSNTHEACLPLFLPKLETTLEIEIIEMEQGEEIKTLETCDSIWKVLSELEADRKSLLINLGGGVVTDLGGFVAATFKRGISFVNVPTTLLAMVDAAVGGKTGVNLDSLKNQIGVIRPADLVLIDTAYLKTLSANEMRSGLAEMLKHGLIRDEDYWTRLINLKDLDAHDLDDLILESITIKEDIVSQDPSEKHLRKSLNYGHTLGHAIESYFLESPTKSKLLHGEAIAAGMIMETFISMLQCGFPSEKQERISKAIINIFGAIPLNEEDFMQIKNLLKFDKKNEKGNINFVLLSDFGKPEIDCQVSNENLDNACSYYLNLN